MSWSICTMPLHVAADGGVDWAAAANVTGGLTTDALAPRPLPRVADVLAAFRAAGCHGTPWFTVDGLGAATGLPPCPDPSGCYPAGGLDLGEVSLYAGDPPGWREMLRPDSGVTAVSFRKPIGIAVLRAVCALTARAGALLVGDDNLVPVVVAWPHSQVADLLPHWPWQPAAGRRHLNPDSSGPEPSGPSGPS